MRCNKKILPPRAPPTSTYQFDYSRYIFDVVTINRVYMNDIKSPRTFFNVHYIYLNNLLAMAHGCLIIKYLTIRMLRVRS